MDMNSELAEPIFKAVSTGWERVFIAKLNAELCVLQKKLTELFGGILDKCHMMMMEAAVPEDRLLGVRPVVEATLRAKLRETSEHIKAQVSEKQKELSRSIVPLVKSKMTPGYDRGMLEAGTGSHRRRVHIMESHVRSECGSMFDAAVAPVTNSVKGMSGEMRKMFQDRCLNSVESQLRINYCSIWEEATPEARKVRENMRVKLTTAMTSAQGALTRLLQSQGVKPKPAVRGFDDDADDDDELVDMTEVVLKEKKAKAFASTINLCGDDEDHLEDFKAAVAAGQAAPGSGAGAMKVKTEKGMANRFGERDANCGAFGSYRY